MDYLNNKRIHPIAEEFWELFDIFLPLDDDWLNYKYCLSDKRINHFEDLKPDKEILEKMYKLKEEYHNIKEEIQVVNLLR